MILSNGPRSMKWINHALIAGSMTAVWRPELVPLAILGSTAPDWLEFGLKALGRYVKHRTSTHIVAYWALGLAFALFAWDWHHAFAAFCGGGLLHCFCDAFTVTGVPLGWWSDRRFHLFGGRLKTGQPGEYWVAGLVMLACVGLSLMTRHWGGGGFSPFFFDWAGYYRDGVIDAKEWKENRFRWL